MPFPAITLPNQFTPRSYQEPVMRFFDEGGKRAISVWHRRAGKDLTALHQTAKMMVNRVGAYWHFFPTAEEGRKAIWEGFTKDGRKIIDTVFPAELVARRNNQQMFLEFGNGAIWRLIGTDNVDNVGAGPVGVVFSEYSLSRPSTYDFVRPMLRENGGWAWFIFTPRGHNHAKKLYDNNKGRPGWFVDLKTVYDTDLKYSSVSDPSKLISADEMLEEERLEGMDDALIRQEYFCDFSAAVQGSVYGDLLEKLEARNGLAAFDHPSDAVFTVWDLGVSDATAIWFFQIANGVPQVIDHYEATGEGMSHYFEVVDGKGFKYLKHYLPHDARNRTFQTGISTIELFGQHFGWDKVAIGPELSLADGIGAARWLLQQPLKIHTRCAEGVEALRQYHYAWDEVKKVFSRTPAHDWASHTADAFRYLACVARKSGLLAKPAAPKGADLAALNQPWRPTLDWLLAHQPKKKSGRI